MSDDPVLNAVQKFMDAVETRIGKQDAEIRSLRNELETRSAPQVIEGPPGKDGKDGKDGADSTIPGPKGDHGEKGENGEDGAPSTLPGPKGDPGERGADSTTPGPRGEPGERGEDGAGSPEEIRAIAREEASLQYRGFYQGVYRADTNYTVGQGATWDGSMWFATRDTKAKPGTDDSWILAVKRGRDGRK